MNDISYNYALNQISMKDSVTGEELTKHNKLGMFQIFLKNSCPLLLLYIKQYNAWIENNNLFINESKVIENTNEKFFQEKYKQLKDCFDLIQSEYSGEIIILYHNELFINEEGKIDNSLSQTGEVLVKVCKEKNITIINMSFPFSEYYYEKNQLPYGFYNTSIGEGHLNKIGHRLIANELYYS